MIMSFTCEYTEELYRAGKSRRFQGIVKASLRKLDQLQVAVDISELRIPPGNRLETLRGHSQRQYGIRINDQ